MPEDIVTKYAYMWPRTVFNIIEGRKLLLRSIKTLLEESGVYVLYRDDHPYYVGKTTKPLYDRIWTHANASRDRYFNFWNYFSAFIVPNKKHLAKWRGS